MHLGQQASAEAYYQIETIHLAMGPPAGTSALLLPPPMSGNSLEDVLNCFAVYTLDAVQMRFVNCSLLVSALQQLC